MPNLFVFLKPTLAERPGREKEGGGEEMEERVFFIGYSGHRCSVPPSLPPAV